MTHLPVDPSNNNNSNHHQNSIQHRSQYPQQQQQQQQQHTISVSDTITPKEQQNADNDDVSSMHIAAKQSKQQQQQRQVPSTTNNNTIINDTNNSNNMESSCRRNDTTRTTASQQTHHQRQGDNNDGKQQRQQQEQQGQQKDDGEESKDVHIVEEEERIDTSILDELAQRIQQQLLLEKTKAVTAGTTIANDNPNDRDNHNRKVNHATISNDGHRTISIHDTNFDRTVVQNEVPTVYEIIVLWDQVVSILRTHLIFISYSNNIVRAYRAVHTTTALYGPMMRTLIQLLFQAAVEHRKRISSTGNNKQHHHHHHQNDMCIECRFVTLLEIVLSYDNPRWEPSTEIRAIWTRLLQRIPTNTSPINFRRKAYRVLVSLSWVPSSKGLLTACSFDETKQTPVYHKEPIRSHMTRITDNGRYQPLPRHDPVNQLLDRLKDETDVCVAITSEKEGMGKTTLAGLVASHPSIIGAFSVVWIDIKQQHISFDLYIQYLKDVCKQLQICEPEWPVTLQRFEESSIKRLREDTLMKIAKRIMSEVISTQMEKAVLFVLDDVQNSDILQWFQFTNHQSIIITTPFSNLTGVDWSLDLLPMSVDEAAELFLHEAGLHDEHVLGKSIELHAIVRECDCHPLTIRIVARWYVLKQVTTGMVFAIQEILDDLQTLTRTRSEEMFEVKEAVNDPNEFIFDVLSLMMGPLRNNEADTPSVLFVICFSAMVVVFPDVAPLDTVILLWEQVLLKEVLATDEIGHSLNWRELSRYIWLIAEALTYMGVISIVEVDGVHMVEVHHNIFREFGTLIAKEMEVKETFHHTAVDWHKYFVTGYLSKKSQGVKENHDEAWKYTMEKLPSHMMHAHMMSTANVVLSQEEFFRARIEALGWNRAIEVQVQDCVQLQHRIESSTNSDDESETLASPVFNRTSVLIQEFSLVLPELTAEARFESIAKAQYLLGFVLTENGYFKDALIYLQMAESLPHESKTLKIKVVYAQCWCFLSLNQTSEAKRKIESIELATSQDKVWLNKEVFQLKAAILLGACNYRAAKILLGELLTALRDDESNNSIELSMILDKLGRIYYLTGDNDLAKETLTNCIKLKNEVGEISRALSSTLSLLGDINIEMRSFNEARDNYNAAILALKKLRCNEQHLDYRFISGKLEFIVGDRTGCYASLELVRKTSNATPLRVYDQSAYDLRFIAHIYEELRFHSDINPVLLESLRLTEKRPLSLERAKSMVSLGKSYMKDGKPEDALLHFQKAREIQVSKYGTYKDSLDTANLIGSAQLALGSNEDAISIFQKNYELAIKTIPNDIESIGIISLWLGDAYMSNGNDGEALNSFTDALAKLLSAERRNLMKIAIALQRLGSLSIRFKDYDKALEFLTEALQIRRDYFDQVSVIETLCGIGRLFRLQGKYDQASIHLIEAIETAKITGCKADLNDIKLELGFAYRLNFELPKAMTIYTEYLGASQRTDPLYGSIIMIIGHIKLAQEKYDEALKDYNVALSIQQQNFGDDDLRTLKVIRSMGIANYFEGTLSIAYDQFERFLHASESALQTNSWTVDIMYVQIVIGDIFYLRREYKEARDRWNQVAKYVSAAKHDKAPEWISSMIEIRLNDRGDIAVHQNNFDLQVHKLLLSDEIY